MKFCSSLGRVQHRVTSAAFLIPLQEGKGSVAGLASSGGRDNKEKKVFISLIGTKGMGCRWVHVSYLMSLVC